METGTAQCITYRNNTFLPSLTDGQRRFLVTPASGVISGRPDMVFGLGRDTQSSTVLTHPESTPFTIPEPHDPAIENINNPPNVPTPQTEDTKVSSPRVNTDMSSSNELAALKASIIQNDGQGPHENMYLEPEHSFLKATSDDGHLEELDSVSQYRPPVERMDSKESSFVKPSEIVKPAYLTETQQEPDIEKQWTEALQKQQDLDLLIDGDMSKEAEGSPKLSRPSQGSAHVRLPSSEDNKSTYWDRGRQFKRVPAKLIRLASLSARNSADSTASKSSFYSPPKPTPKVVTLEEAINSRPPLRIDMEGPTPCTYSPRNKPLHEKNSPSWTFGQKCYIEKSKGPIAQAMTRYTNQSNGLPLEPILAEPLNNQSGPSLVPVLFETCTNQNNRLSGVPVPVESNQAGGARTSWGKMWFQSPNVWQHKVDFNADVEWPSPAHYPHPPLLGQKQHLVHEAPSYSIGVRKNTSSFFKIGIENMPSPVDYDRQTADRQTHPRQPAFTHQFRREGTVLWGCTEPTPGPGAYSPRGTNLHRSHTISGYRRDKTHNLGPFSFL